MSERDVIQAFLDGGELSEASLRTDGKRLFSAGRLIAEKRGERLHVAEDVAGGDPKHRKLLVEFVEWREQRAKVLRLLLRAKEMPTIAIASRAQALSARSQTARPGRGL